MLLENEIILTDQTQQEIETTIVWAKYAAIVQIASIGLGLLQVVLGFINSQPLIGATLFSFFISTAIGLVLANHIYKYANCMKQGVQGKDSVELYKSLYHLKTYFAVMGVLFLIAICLLVLGLLIGLLVLLVK